MSLSGLSSGMFFNMNLVSLRKFLKRIDYVGITCSRVGIVLGIVRCDEEAISG